MRCPMCNTEIDNPNRMFALPHEIEEINNKINHAWEEKDGECPYCLTTKEPTNQPCKHWCGHGWQPPIRWDLDYKW
jgi:hypothetical protein